MTAAFEDPALDLAAWPSSTSMPGLSSSVWVASGKFVDGKPEVLRAYMRAFFKGGQWVNENLGKKSYIDLVAGFTKMAPERLAKLHTAGQRMDIEPAAINGVAKVMKEFGLLKSDIDVTNKIFR
jgi:ABC-type nitrate/sulfonate/bicarbonate transport system substrate-binding protein